jgi:AcrR family transcriptional regulator
LPAKAGLHDEIVRASIQLGSELGEEGLTMRAIAARLGVSATALYQHFESKSAILKEIRLLGVRTLLEQQQASMEVQDPIVRVHRLAKTYIDFALGNPWLYKVLFVEEQVDWASVSEEDRKHLVAPLEQAKQAFEAGVQANVFRSDLDVHSSALLLWASVHGLATLLISGRISENHPAYPVPNRDAFVGAFIDGLIRSISA